MIGSALHCSGQWTMQHNMKWVICATWLRQLLVSTKCPMCKCAVQTGSDSKQCGQCNTNVIHWNTAQHLCRTVRSDSAQCGQSNTMQYIATGWNTNVQLWVRSDSEQCGQSEWVVASMSTHSTTHYHHCHHLHCHHCHHQHNCHHNCYQMPISFMKGFPQLPIREGAREL